MKQRLMPLAMISWTTGSRWVKAKHPNRITLSAKLPQSQVRFLVFLLRKPVLSTKTKEILDRVTSTGSISVYRVSTGSLIEASKPQSPASTVSIDS